ncbi:MAG: HAD-IA family hydrolase [Alphaproteobacteria bacterium]|nr:HAD-IA family hydrolase [Alphaproteobacteria bacterium]
MTLSTKHPKAFIFDWDNTLVDSWYMIYDIINHVMYKYKGERWTMEQIQENTHLSAKDNFPKIFGDQAEEALSDLKSYANEIHANSIKNLKLLPGAMDLLMYLKENAIPCAILSNKYAHRLRIEVEYLGLTSYFTGVFGSTDFAFDKPHPHPAEQVLLSNHTDAKETWFVGDTPVDWECARNVGCQPVAVGQMAHLDTEPKMVFSGLSDMLDYLKKDCL